MKEDIYCIACQCQTIINKQIKVSHNETKCFFKMHKDNATMLKIK